MTESDDIPTDLDGGLWMTVAGLARAKGVSRQTIHQRVARLVADGKLTVRGDGRAKQVNVAQYDFAVGQAGDAYREAAAETRALDDTPLAPGLRDHQARAAQYTADLKFLELEERLGRLLPIDDVRAAGIAIGEAVIEIVDQLPTYAETMAAAVVAGGAAGARGEFIRIKTALRAEIASKVTGLAATAVPPAVETRRD